MMIEQLLGDTPFAKFVEEYYLKLPFARSSGCTQAQELGNWDAIDRLLAHHEIDAIAGRAGERWPGERIVPENARQIVHEGYTLGIRHAQRHDSALASLAAEFEAAFGGKVDIHLYCTPAGEPGFGWHYDAEEVFILQTAGSKQWRLRKNTVHPWPLIEAIPSDQRYDREIMPVMQCNLLPGDWLYIPGGYWHSTQAGEESISLSVGVQAPTALDVYDYLRTELLDSLRWRQRLPLVGSVQGESGDMASSQLQELCVALGNDLLRQLTAPNFLQRFLETRRRP
jgi:50S ribosomal protein L16 3-hydroxylase